LIEVGLPYKEDWTLRFDPEADHVPRLPNKSNCRRIGFVCTLGDSLPMPVSDEVAARLAESAYVSHSPPITAASRQKAMATRRSLFGFPLDACTDAASVRTLAGKGAAGEADSSTVCASSVAVG
jgi:hypothetical protein